MRFGIRKSTQGVAIAVSIAASSGSLAGTGHPVKALGNVAFNLAAIFAEMEEARQKVIEALIVPA